jgi:transcriptional regulator with GAF, ATPase, and Fis domain
VSVESQRFELVFDSVRALLLDLARERALPRLLALVVERLSAHPDAALARIWLVRDGDICSSCPMRESCQRKVPCLHLVASAGRPIAQSGADWSRIDGEFRRFPIGIQKVGSVAATAEAVCVEDTRHQSRWVIRPDWAEREGIVGFGGQPLVYHGEILGVLGLFTRSRFPSEALASLRMVADHAAAAIAHSRVLDENADLRRRLELENEYLRDEIDDSRAFGEILGVSKAIRRIEEQIGDVARTDATVLILGESGTGKELVAREIHRRSDRAGRSMIRVNCASIPKDLFESEFFGHVRGAFTGAVQNRDGRFAAADGGTLFLDEVGEIPLELQSKLLRVLEAGQFQRVGEDRTHTVDVRVLAATNRSLAREREAGRFREDLFYRLSVFPIEVPPLRERAEDIPLLAGRFLARASQKLKRSAHLTEDDLTRLQRYDWPGNVRELQNTIERAVITAKQGRLGLHIPRDDRPAAISRRTDTTRGFLTEEAIRQLELENLRTALDLANGKIYGKGGAAELLGMKPTTLASRLQRLGLKRAAPR